jgi:hypothetical protein
MWRQYPFIKDHMKKIRKILIKARLDRRGKDKAYIVKDLELSSEDNAVSSDKETTEIKLNYKFSLLQWITDTGATVYMIN